MTEKALIDPRQFRAALGSFTTGVTIVTTRDGDGRDIGLTVNSFNSVSLEPPLVLWSLARNSRSLPAFMNGDYFAVHILAADQEVLSARFAGNVPDKFAGYALGRGHGGVPLLEGCAARFECRTAYRYEGGDHEIFVGEVLVFEHFDHPPLVFQKGGYAIAVKKHAPPVELPDGDADGSFRTDFLVYLLGLAHSLLNRQTRAAMQSHDLGEAEYYVLAALGIEDGRSTAELDTLLQLTDRSVTSELLAALSARGLIRVDAGSVHLTPAGRAVVISFVSVSKAVEEDALREIDYSEAHLLKQLLRRLIRNSMEKP